LLAPQIRQMAIEVLQLEAKHTKQGAMLEASMDMYNELFQWATDTEDERAAKAVLAIMNKHLSTFKKAPVDFLFALNAPGGVDQGNPE
jgi:hypothetical protein